MLLLASGVALAADWSFNEKSDPGRGRAYTAGNGQLEFNCTQPGGAELRVRIDQLGWRQAGDAEATVGFLGQKSGLMGYVRQPSPILAMGRLEITFGVAVRVSGSQALDVASKLADYNTVAVTVDLKNVQPWIPTPARMNVSLAGASGPLKKLVQACGAGG
jgi:hypothetical protein